MNIIYILLALSILLFIFAYYLSGRDILSPSVVMCIMFIISTMFAIMNIENWNIHYALNSVIILAGGMLVFIIAEASIHMMVLQRRFIHDCTNKIDIEPITVQVPILLITCIFDLITLAWFYLEIKRIVKVYGYNTAGVGVFGRYRTILTSLAQRSDSTVPLTGFILNQMIKLLHAMGYVSLYILINNWFANRKKGTHYILHSFILFMHIFSYIMEGSRANILQIASAGLIQWYIIWHRKVGWKKILTVRVIAIGLIGILFGMPIFYKSLSWMGRATNKNLIRYIGFYAGGSIQLFNLYVQNYTSTPKVFGEETLGGILKALNKIGFKIEIRNMNLDMIQLDELSRGNVYTFFRRPLHDFGMIGMIIFTILVSWLFAWIYYGKIKYKNNSHTPYWILLYGYMFYWIVMMSIDQYSHSYLSLTTIVQIGLIFFWYVFVTHFKFKFYNKRIILQI